MKIFPRGGALPNAIPASSAAHQRGCRTGRERGNGLAAGVACMAGWWWAAVVAVIATSTATAAHAALPTPTQVRTAFVPSDTTIVSREGEVLHRLRTDLTVRRGQWVALADVSPALRLALVASEDQRFYAHSGIDWQAVSAAAWGQLWHRRTRGASTITMQLAGLLDEDWRAVSGGRSVGQKLGQAVAATQLERQWRKDQILEAYLNLVPFRGELVGIDALSRTLLGKAPHGLDAVEAAVAAALVRGPNASPHVVAQRACTVWRQGLHLQGLPAPAANSSLPAHAHRTMGAGAGRGWPTGAGAFLPFTPPRAPQTTVQAVAAGATEPDCSTVQWRTEQALRGRHWPASEGIAPHWARRVLREAARGNAAAPAPMLSSSQVHADGGAAGAVAATTLRSTVSAPVQRVALQAVQRHLRELQGRNVEDGAVVVLDNASGAVLAWVGSSGELSQAAEVDGVLALRQPGSTLKPFLYAQAMAEGRLTAASLIEDSAAHIATGGGLYIPQNYDRRFKGWVSVRTALAGSLNVPAVRALAMVTPDAFFAQLQALGLPLRESAGYYGYSLALGSAEVALLPLTDAYRTLANGGQRRPVASALLPPTERAGAQRGAAQQVHQGQPTPNDSARLFPAGVAFIVGDILADPQARAATFGWDSVLATRFWTAVKTGTSKDMRDNWAVGWSQRYTVGVWVGNASGAAMHGVSGSSGAAPIWAEVMAVLHRAQPSRPPGPPPWLLRQRVHFAGAQPGQVLEPSRDEWLLPGTQHTQWALAAAPPPGARAGGSTAPAARSHAASARILQPVDGTVLAIDPDIPPQRQQLRLHASRSDVRWRMNGQAVGAGQEVWWPVWPGRHTLQLHDARGRLLQTVTFEVRGAGVRAAAAPP